MKKAQTPDIAAQFAAFLAFQAAQAAPSTVAAAPAATATIDLPGWVQDAKAAGVATAAAAPVAAPAARVLSPLEAEVITINPKDGATWQPFRVLHVHNGHHGKGYRGVRIDARQLALVRAFKGSL